MQLSPLLQLKANLFTGNAVWFSVLAVLFILLLIYTFWQKRDLKLVALFFCMSGMAGYLENIIFFLLRSYEYYPRILENRYYDMTLGAYLSQRFFVSSVATFIAAFNLGLIPVLLFAAMFVGIEYLFLALKLYKLNWWNSAYTGAGLLMYFWLSKKIYKGLLKATSRFIRFIVLFCMTYTLYTDIIAIPTLAGHYRFDVNWFEDPARNTVIAILIYCTVRSFVIALVCIYRLHWSIMASIPVLVWISYLVFMNLQIFTFKYGWDLAVFAASDVAVLACCYYFNRVLSKGLKPRIANIYD